MDDWLKDPYDDRPLNTTEDLSGGNQTPEATVDMRKVAKDAAKVEKQARLDKFLAEQEAAEAGEARSETEVSDAKEAFEAREQILSDSDKSASQGYVSQSSYEVIVQLDSNQRLLPGGAVDGNVLVIEDSKPVWGSGGLPPAPAEEGKLLISNGEDPPGWDAGYLTWR